MFDYESKLVDSSRRIADLVVADIGNNPGKFAEVMDIALRDEYPLSMRAARVIALCIENNPGLIVPHQQKIVDAFENLSVEGVKRSFLKIFAEIPVEINEELIGILTDRSFNWLVDEKEAIAIRYYAIDILLKVVKIYPEIKGELTDALNYIRENDSTALQTKSKKVINYLMKIR